MRNRSKLLLATLSATIMLAALVGMASASRFALSSQSFRITWASLEFIGPFNIAFIRCPVTMEGSFHSSTLSKVLESLIGYVTSVAIATAACTGGSALVLTTNLPWILRYNGFTAQFGLPNIDSIRLRLFLAEFLLIREFLEGGQRCLYSSAVTPLRGIVTLSATREARTLTPEAGRIPLVNEELREPGAPACSTTYGLKGESTSLTQQGSAAKVTVTLVA
jgi:hypothetical protein